ncbi:SDR family oxidoreductase [Eubacterium sp.]|uniref:SDR family NAD(P)-dependent oxidoreductase n=1 Tax=Eubacterium sp. TaxID=142586 RepID=UPI0025E728EA|nr:SDR family oxidoreductase [Eubacterium sp.]MCR5629687.1 SDR family oxidoreductase [Eubacterium sp.]
MRIIIITGASSGMGREFARQLDGYLEHIDEFWLIARRTDRLHELSKELKKDCRIFECDLSQRSSMVELIQELETKKPKVKMLINCAGYGKTGKFEKLNYQDVTGMIDVNCRALSALTYSVLPYMCSNSRIINLASVAAFMPQPEFSVYAASKAYVLRFSRALRREVDDRGIWVTTICPGPVNTEFFDVADNKNSASWYKSKVMVKCEDVVNRALYDSLKKRDVSIYGIPMKFMYVISKIFPHRLTTRIIHKLNIYNADENV